MKRLLGKMLTTLALGVAGLIVAFVVIVLAAIVFGGAATRVLRTADKGPRLVVSFQVAAKVTRYASGVAG